MHAPAAPRWTRDEAICRLDFTLMPQAPMAEGCWAAVVASLLNHHHRRRVCCPCGVAQHYHLRDRLACCPDPRGTGCDRARDLDDVLDELFEWTPDRVPPTRDRLAPAVQAGSTVVLLIDAHFYVVVGAGRGPAHPRVYLREPLEPERERELTDGQLFGTWAATYRVDRARPLPAWLARPRLPCC